MFNARNSGPLYLPGVEAHHQPGPYQKLIADAKSRGAEYSKIWDLFAFKNEFTVHLARFSQGVMRLPATISPGLRELIAAYTSYQNECAFCTQAHAAAAAELLQDEALVWKVLRDVETSGIPEKDKLLLRFVGKVTKNLPAVTSDDVATLQAARLGRRGDLLRDHDLRAVQLLQPLDHGHRRARDVGRGPSPAGQVARLTRLRPRVTPTADC